MKHLIRLWCQTSTTLLVLSAPGHAATLTVSPGGQGIFPTLQSAIDAAAVGDTVLALPGTFSGPGNRDLDFGGKDLSLIGRDGSAYTTIDCEHASPGLYLHNGETLSALFSGFTVVNGGTGESNGGAVYCYEASLTVSDLHVPGAAVFSCTGICVIYGSLVARNLALNGTGATGYGGCLGFYWAVDCRVEDSILSGGHVSGHGGAVDVWESSVEFSRVAFQENYGGITGGAIRAKNSTLTCVDCIFQGNSARDGAGIALSGSVLTLLSSEFLGNYASRWGAALYYDSQGEPSGGLVEYCDFRGNNSQYGSIIVLMNEASPVLRHLSIVDNNHGDGIGAGCCAVAAQVENCLIAFNRGGFGINDNPSGGSWLWPVCTNVYGNEFGEYENADQTGVNGNISEDPQLCDPSYETLGVADSSPCLPENNTCGVLIGNHSAECTLTAVGAPAPPGVTLEANYPNPFNPSTTIPFSLGDPGAVTLTIHDVGGRVVCVLADDRNFPSGRHALRWNGRDTAGQPAPSGVYFYRLETSAGATARPMLLVK